MSRYGISYISPGGREWDFTALEWTAGIKQGGISGLVGDVQDSIQTPVGSDSQIVEYQQALPMEGSITFHIRGDGGRDAGEVWADFRRDFSRTKQGTLFVDSPMGRVSCRVRLASPIAAPQKDPAFDEVVLNVEIALIADKAGWWFPELRSSQAGVVQVVNNGDLFIYPALTWTNAGQVTVPSGAKFNLPAVSTSRTVQLAYGGVGRVTDANGVLDKALRSQLTLFPSEGVPAGETRSFTIPAGSVLAWRVGVLDPWQ